MNVTYTDLHLCVQVVVNSVASTPDDMARYVTLILFAAWTSVYADLNFCLQVVVSGVASTPDDVARYVACTLLAASLPPGDNSSAALITSCLTFLEDNEFVTLHNVQDSGKLIKTLFLL